METITDAISVHSIKKEAYAKLAASNSANAGYLPSFTLYDHFLTTYGEPGTISYRKAQDAFMKSLASYSIVSYLLQIKDRHNGNILLDKKGHAIRTSSSVCPLKISFLIMFVQISTLDSCSQIHRVQ